MQSKLLPAFHFFWRQRQKEFRTDLNLPFPSSRLALTSFVLDRNQPHHRLFPPSDNNLFASASPLNPARSSQATAVFTLVSAMWSSVVNPVCTCSSRKSSPAVMIISLSLPRLTRRSP